MERIDYITRKWWFFVILVISQFLFLPYASKNFQVEQINTIIYTTLTNSIQLKISSYSVYFQILSLIILVLLIVLKNRMKLIFNLYVAVSYILFAFVQNIAITEKYGWSIVTVNVIMFLFVAMCGSSKYFNRKMIIHFPLSNGNIAG